MKVERSEGGVKMWVGGLAQIAATNASTLQSAQLDDGAGLVLN
jgi:predicted phage tail protein